MSNLDPQQVTNVLSQLIGLKCSGSLVAEACALIVYLGDIITPEPLMTEWRLWVDCAWRLENSDGLVAGSLDDAQVSVKALRVLEGQTLRNLEFQAKTHDLILQFDGEKWLRVFPHSVMDEQWQLRKSDGYRLTFGPAVSVTERRESPDVQRKSRKGRQGQAIRKGTKRS